MQKRKKKKKDFYSMGSKIFLACLGFLALIYIVDIALFVSGREHVEITREVLETVKTLLFTISGYLFGKNTNHYSKEKNKENE